MNVEENYNSWICSIAESKDLDGLISHFREHVYEHYNKHERLSSSCSMDTWMTGVLNFMHIFEKKLPYITLDDKLFKLCTYYQNHPLDGPKPSFNVSEFLQKYEDGVKQSGLEDKYNDWVCSIAESKGLDRLVQHFREHVYWHYDRHKNKGTKRSMDIWIAEAINFMHIFEKKLPHITTSDKLFKLCTHYLTHLNSGPEPDFDIETFLKEYDGEIKQLEINTINNFFTPITF